MPRSMRYSLYFDGAHIFLTKKEGRARKEIHSSGKLVPFLLFADFLAPFVVLHNKSFQFNR